MARNAAPALQSTQGMDVILSHREAVRFVNRFGFKGFVAMMERKYKRGLYSCSTYWYEQRTSSYICKFRGARGDLIVEWSENYPDAKPAYKLA